MRDASLRSDKTGTLSFRNTTILLLSLLVTVACREPDKPGPFPGLPNDLEAVVWAESPLLYNPTNIDVDARGRLWVTEAVNYRNFNNDSSVFPHHPKGDRILILEDTDYDGVADKSTVFAQDQDLVSPLGIAVIGNKVYVSCSPNLIVFTDDNGDDIPDKKEILLTGFGGVDHDHSLHALLGGPDGNLYFTTGNAGPHNVTDRSGWTLRSGSIYTGGSPYNSTNQGNLKSDDGKVWVGGLTLRINPSGEHMKVMAHNFRNSYEVFVDSRGDLWQNDNDDEVLACRTAWIMEGGNAGYFSADGTRYWRADHRPWQNVFTAHWHQDDPGVMPAGDRTGAGAPTGIVLLEHDALGKAYRGMLLSADAGRNTIFAYHPTRNGSGFALGDRVNLITSLTAYNPRYVWNDSANHVDPRKWFRPSDVAVGTDGSLFVADWYDPVVGGHQMRDTIAYGRIYRIVPKGLDLQLPQLDFSTTQGLLDGFRNPAVNVRFDASRLLEEKGDTVVDDVRKFLDDENPFIRYRAIWLLSRLGNKGINEVEQLLSHEDPEIRVVALRAMRHAKALTPQLVRQLANDASSLVRREVAIALTDVPYPEKKDALITLAQGCPADDPWYACAIAGATRGYENDLYSALSGSVQPLDWPPNIARVLWTLHPSDAVRDFQMRATQAHEMQDRLDAVTALAFIPHTSAAKAMLHLTQDSTDAVREQALYWASFRRGNDWHGLLDWNKTALDAEYQNTLATMQVKMSMALNPELSSYERNRNAAELAANPVGGQLLLTKLMDNTFPEELYPAIARRIASNPDPGVRYQTMRLLNVSSVPTISVSKVLALEGNELEGKLLFEKNCTPCHTVNQKGGTAGPDLSNIAAKYDRSSLVDAIVDPGAGIAFGYEAWTVTTNDGSSLFGFVVADNENALVVRDLSGNLRTLDTSSIVSRVKQEGSLMPTPDNLGMSAEEVAHVAAYLLALPN